MKLKLLSFFKIKFALPLFVITVLITDIILHKGMVAVLLPHKFCTDSITTLHPHNNTFINFKNKIWMKGVNNIYRAKAIIKPSGIECDAYYDSIRNDFFLYHDSSNISSQGIEKVISILSVKDLLDGLWIDFKNLSVENAFSALNKIKLLDSLYNLKEKLLIESSNAEALSIFRKSGYFTSYYTPFFNPYLQSIDANCTSGNTIAETIEKYPPNALSGYYFQYPFLKKAFPAYPILIWTDKQHTSLVSYFFFKKIINDNSIKIILPAN